MKILIVGPSPEKSKGGMATVIKEIRDDERLNSKYDIDIFDSYIDGGVIKRLIYSIWAYLKFIVTKRNYDIYHIHAASRMSTFRKAYYVRAIKRWGKKVIFHIHGAEYMEFFDELSINEKNKMIKTLKSVNTVIALSQDWKKKFDSKFELSNCVVLENGIDTNRFKAAIVEIAKYKETFVSLGRLGKRKGTYDIIDATEIVIKKVPEFKCFLAGDGEIEMVKNLISEKGLKNNLEVIGWIDDVKKIELLSKVSTLVLPSYNEGLPMSILEGMACGKAIISTTVGAIPEVVQQKNGILISPGDIKALADAFIKCSTDIEMIQEMSKNNIKVIEEQFSMGIMHTKLQEIYNSI